jgi:putative transposase
MVVRIAGKRMYLWRAVDHEGEVLDMLVQRWRDKRAAIRLMRKLLKKQGFTPKLLTTDKISRQLMINLGAEIISQAVIALVV